MFLTEISVRPKRPAGEQAQQRQTTVASAQQQSAAGQRNQAQMQQGVQKQQAGQQQQAQPQQANQQQQSGNPLDNWKQLSPEQQSKKIQQFMVGIKAWIKANPALKETIITVLRNASQNK